MPYQSCTHSQTFPKCVMQSKSVRLFLTDGMRRSTRIVSEPGNHIQRTIPAGTISAACRVFPLRLCGQAIVVPVPLTIDRLTKLLRIFPAHTVDGKRWALGIARVGSHDRLILCLRNLVFAHLKRPGNRYSMNRLFFGVAFMISCRTAHHEASRRNAHDLHALEPLLH